MDPTYDRLFEQNIFEAKEAFSGLADENTWKRPAEGLLSVGEIAGHVAYWMAVRLAGDDDAPPWVSHEGDLSKCRVSSPLVDRRFRYYPATLAEPPSPEHLAMTAQQVCDEMVRVISESWAFFKSRGVDLDAREPSWPENFSYRAMVEYLIFHVAYHTGQMYTVRHLLGEETPDN
jgi:hypothetical protein